MRPHHSKRPAHLTTMTLIVLALISQACTFSLIDWPLFPSQPTLLPGHVGPSPTPQPMAQTTFIVTLPEPLTASETLVLALLDEVTGLSLNPTMYPMSPRDSLNYTAVLPLPLNSVVKYRYVRRSNVQIMEDTNLGASIRYRLYSVTGPGEVHDILGDWADKVYARQTGSIQGRILNGDTGTPVPNTLVTAAGVQFLTDSAGRFDLQGLPVGVHNLVAYSLDGIYQPFQQGAAVGPGQNTAVELRLRPAAMVSVTFSVVVPANSVPGAPVRVAGNLLQLGNTFADLQGGVSTNADRMPVMNLTADGRYQTTVSLPIGAYVQYKYTLGDGFWNAEHKTGGQFVLREFIVPAQDLILQDQVESWQAGTSAPILFEVTVPPVTPPGDIIYIQFNPYGWTEPLPMWPLGNNRWAYKLYSPLNMLGSFYYRYCRNGQCGSADDTATAGDSATGRAITTSLAAQDIQDTVTAWEWYENPEPTTLVGAPITPRAAGFTAGVELQPSFRPNWSYYAPQALTNIQALGANQVVITPTWTYTTLTPLGFTPMPGKDPMWIDSAIMVSQARALGLNVAIFPAPNFPSTARDFWSAAPRDFLWWQTWFDHYRAFAVNYADLASQTGAQTLILGGDWLVPALPGGSLADGSPSNVPGDAELRWKTVLSEVRQHFSGNVLWALPYTKGNLPTTLTFLQDADGIYLLWSAALTGQPEASKADLANEAGRLLDNEVSPLASLLNKPVFIAVTYPSGTGAASGCLPDGTGGCLDWSALSRPNGDIDTVALTLQSQADLYEAMLTAINGRAWVSGVVSRGFYPPAVLQDKSASTHGKPAADILWYWYPRMLGVVQ
jgi:hypothetical protein